MKKLLLFLFLFTFYFNVSATIILDNDCDLKISITTELTCSSLVTITVEGSGGVPPYEFSIDGGSTWQSSTIFTNLIADDYSVQIRDSSECFKEGELITIPPYEEMVIDTIVTNALNGTSTLGSIEVLVIGGVPPFEYSIDGGVTYSSNNIFENLIPDISYLIGVRDTNGCLALTNEEIIIDNVSPLDINITISNTTCFDASDATIFIDVAGGQAPYNYQLTNLNNGFSTNTVSNDLSFVFTNIEPSDYEVKVIDSNNLQSESQIISIIATNPVIINESTVTPTGNEASGNISVTATGGSGNYSYSINGLSFNNSGDFFDLDAGDYIINAIDLNGCLSSDFTFTIAQIDVDNSVVEKATGGLTANYKNATSYQWINADTKERILGATNIDFIPSEYGNYQVEMIIPAETNFSAKGSANISLTQTVLSPIISYTSGLLVLGLNDYTNSFEVYPNPTNNFINVPSSLINKNYIIYDVLGKIVNRGSINKTTLDFIELATGIYYLKIPSFKTVKIIKE